ncbi:MULTISPECIES: winged helix-turn-helix domain-containing protein [Glycomyces]|uniref:DNA-binding response OmpR family regulator n=2 Tax=Glycomyces TaxID=58113 RepID=A0A9X3PDL9_9ACTN|nr:winged helix-turn-helix domain-containing protein [Glycomyces lechevalierae]MDA1383664.1 winged helix-turn-helix domain-containing protein [Glycomyces lechevalierae]MDR7341345.1 DNA-binding response OmpR family regulator [Glycomyces lechevalierae]
MTPVPTRTRPQPHRRTGAPTVTVTIEIPADDPRLVRRLTAALAGIGQSRITVAPDVPALEAAQPEAAPPAGPKAAPALVIDVPGREVLLRGAPVALTRLEFELLAFLARYPGMVHTRAELLQYVWETPDTGLAGRTVDVHVRRLRSKLGEFDELVGTVRGVGYRFARSREVEYRTGTASPAADRLLGIEFPPSKNS